MAEVIAAFVYLLVAASVFAGRHFEDDNGRVRLPTSQRVVLAVFWPAALLFTLLAVGVALLLARVWR